MKIINSRFNRLKSIGNLLEEYDSKFNANPGDAAAKEAYLEKMAAFEILFQNILRPLHAYQIQEQQTRQLLQTQYDIALGRALAVAHQAGDVVLEQTLKSFKTGIKSGSYQKLRQKALFLCDAMAAHTALGTDMGLTSERLAQLRAAATQAETQSAERLKTFALRRMEREALKTLSKETQELLKMQIDWIVKDQAATAPELYQRYQHLRLPKKRKKQKVLEWQCDVSGVVKDQLTGAAIQGAVVSLVGYDTNAETDADGYYLLDELEQGDYVVSCVAYGYQIPETVSFSLGEQESTEVDFELVPLAAI